MCTHERMSPYRFTVKRILRHDMGPDRHDGELPTRQQPLELDLMARAHTGLRDRRTIAILLLEGDLSSALTQRTVSIGVGRSIRDNATSPSVLVPDLVRPSLAAGCSVGRPLTVNAICSQGP